MKRLELRIDVGGNLSGRRFTIPPEGLRLGRSSSNDIPIADEELSRNHCLFEPFGEYGIRVTDLASANGTYVNGVKLGDEAQELRVGDVMEIGSSRITVVGEEEGTIDLGLGGDSTAGAQPANEAAGKKPRSPLVNVLWIVAALTLAGAGYLLLTTPGADATKEAQPTEIKTERKLLELNYEKVDGDTNSIFRYEMEYTPSGSLRITMDDVGGEDRHLNRAQPLSDAAKARLSEIVMDPSLQTLDREYTGPMCEPPKLASRTLKIVFTDRSRTVRIVNAPEPDAFRRVRERLEAFSMNELGVRALQYSRERLLEMAAAAAETGRMKWEDRDVEHGNIHASISAYSEALMDLETVNPKPAVYEEYRTARERAEKELAERYRNQRFVAEQATSLADWEKARAELRILCELVPDRDDPRYREAAAKLLDVEARLKKGGAK